MTMNPVTRSAARGGHNFPCTESLRGATKTPNNVTTTFFNTVHLLPKDLKFEHGGAKVVSYPGRRLTSLILVTPLVATSTFEELNLV